ANQDSNVVVDHAESTWSDLWKREDYWAIWLGFILLIAAIFIFIDGAPATFKETIDKSNAIMKVEAEKAPFKTIAYIKAQDAKKAIAGTSLPAAKAIKSFIATPSTWVDNPVAAFFLSKEDADAKNAAKADKMAMAKLKMETSFAFAQTAEASAAAAEYKDQTLNTAAEAAIGAWIKAKADNSKAASLAKPKNLFTSLPLLLVAFGVFFGVGVFIMGKNTPKFLIGFVGVFVVAVIAMLLGNQSSMKYYGIGVEPWAIIIGMLIANTVGTPQWMKGALEVEYYIKTGLVLLGAEILFDKIVAIGTPGIFVAWVVTPIVLITTFIFGQKVLKMASPTLNMVISADMSVCGTSAAIATAAACRAKKE
ncbi:MAG: putative sulfate exporter family transporter, partial [Bilophila sp.]